MEMEWVGTMAWKKRISRNDVLKINKKTKGKDVKVESLCDVNSKDVEDI